MIGISAHLDDLVTDCSDDYPAGCRADFAVGVMDYSYLWLARHKATHKEVVADPLRSILTLFLSNIYYPRQVSTVIEYTHNGP